MNANKQRSTKGGSRTGGGKPRRSSKSTRAKGGVKPRTQSESAPLAQSRSRRTGAARVSVSNSNGQRSCTIRHSELFAQVSTESTFEPIGFDLNPGQSRVFPWLSVQAGGWERYRFEELRIEFLSRVNAGTDGIVTMGVDYDAADVTPDSELELMAYQNSTQDAIWKNQTLVMSPDSLNGPEKSRYVRTSVAPLVNSATKRQDNAGIFWASILSPNQGVTAGSFIVHYVVKFMIPQLISGDNTSAIVTVPGTGNTITNWLGNALALGSIGLNQGAIVQGTRTFLTNLIPGQPYRMLMGAVGSGFTSSVPFSFSPELSPIQVGPGLFGPTALQFAYDVISSVRDTYFDFKPALSGASLTSGLSVFSMQPIPTIDITE